MVILPGCEYRFGSCPLFNTTASKHEEAKRSAYLQDSILASRIMFQLLPSRRQLYLVRSIRKVVRIVMHLGKP